VYRKEPETCRRRRFTAEQIVAKSRQIEVLLSHENRAASRKDSGITDQTYCRWRREYGGLQLEQAKKLKDQQKENAQLKRALATLTLQKSILKDIADGNC
jgi:transposase-like protein